MYFSPDYVCKVCNKSFSRSCKLQNHMTLHSKENHMNGVSYPQLPDRFDSGHDRFEQSSACSLCDDDFTRKDHIAKDIQPFYTNDTKKNSTESIQNSKVLRKRYKSRSSRAINSHAKKDDSGKIYYECEVCKLRLTQMSSLRSHMRKHTGERPYKCKDCKKSFTFYQCLWNHARKHTGEKRFECKLCSKRFVYYQCLWNHEKVHTDERPFECKVCGKRYAFMYRLKIHSKQHTGERPYECTICKNRFLRLACLKVHYKKHSEERPFERNIRKKRSRCSSYLCRHRKWHTKHSPKDSSMLKKIEGNFKKIKGESLRLKNRKCHQCCVCKEGDVNSKSYSDPTEICPKEKSCKCHVCGKKLSSFTRLRIHLRIHTGEKPYKCSLCAKAFIEHTGLWKHEKVHADEKPYGCQRKVFEQNLKLYTQSQKSDSRSRPNKGQRNKSSRMCRSYYAHENRCVERKVKSFKCKVCKEKFVCSSHLKRHVMKHSDIKPYVCTDCNKRFKLKGWLIRHCKFVHKNWYENSTSMEYACKQCKTVFFSNNDAVNHQKCIRCRRCGREFYCSYMFCCHTVIYSCQNEFQLEAAVGRDIESSKTNFRARHNKKDLDEFEKNLNGGSYVLPYNYQNPVEMNDLMLTEKPDVLQNYINAKASSSQDFTGSQVYFDTVPSVYFPTNYDDMTCHDLGEWVGDFNLLNKTVIDGKSDLELKNGYIWDTTYIMPNTVCASIKCRLCGETFDNETAYTYHSMQHFLAHEGHQCLLCGDIFADAMDFIAHATGHITID